MHPARRGRLVRIGRGVTSPPRHAAMPRMPDPTTAPIVLRTELAPGDAGEIVRQHGLLYAAEHGFDATFEAYVAQPLAEFVLRADPDERVWVARRGDDDSDAGWLGCIAIVRDRGQPRQAQLRWYLVHPRARGLGLGRRLMDAAVGFCRERGYASVSLWTLESLHAAQRVYRHTGFVLDERREPRLRWGREVVEERHVLALD